MIHLIGGNGYIGKRLSTYLKERSVLFDSYSEKPDNEAKFLDITSFVPNDYHFDSNDIAIVLAAISSPDLCTNNYKMAYGINVIGTTNFINYCLSVGCKVIFFSSDAVNGPTFGKANDEFSKVHPFGKYAEMKYEIESRFKSCKLFKTIRLSYVLSDCDKFTNYLISCTKNKTSAKVFNGLYRNTIYLDTVLESVYMLSTHFDFNDYYLCNISGNQLLSRLDLANKYKKEKDPFLSIEKIDVPKEILESRPNVIETKSLFLEKLLGHKLADII